MFTIWGYCILGAPYRKYSVCNSEDGAGGQFGRREHLGGGVERLWLEMDRVYGDDGVAISKQPESPDRVDHCAVSPYVDRVNQHAVSFACNKGRPK